MSVRWFFPVSAVWSGILLIACFPPFDQGWLVWIALIPVLLGATWGQPKSCPPSRGIFRIGYGLGLIYFGGVFWWIGLVTMAGTVVLTLYLALYPAVWLWWAARIWPERGPYPSWKNLGVAMELASVWVALEWLRGWLFTGFGWNNLGVALHGNVAFLQGARLGGVLLLSWLAVLLNGLAALTVRRFSAELRGQQPLRSHFDLMIGLLAVAVLFAYGLRESIRRPAGAPRELSFAAVQPNIPQNLENPLPLARVWTRYQALTEYAMGGNPQLILWPEATTGQSLLDDPALCAAWQRMVERMTGSFLMGSIEVQTPHYYNAAWLFPPGGGVPQTYHKNNLVIFGEYIPGLAEWPALQKIAPFPIDFTPGADAELWKLPGTGVTLAPLICFEDTLPRYVRKVAQKEPDLLVNMTNDGWFQRSPGAAQHLANAVFRAVENDRPLLRCANTGVTAVISSHGVVEQVLQDDRGNRVGMEGVLTGTVRWFPARMTPYHRYGDWIVLVSVLIVFIAEARRRFTRPSRESPEAPDIFH